MIGLLIIFGASLLTSGFEMNQTKGSLYQTFMDAQMESGRLLLNYTLTPPQELINTLCMSGDKIRSVHLTMETQSGDSNIFYAITNTLRHYVEVMDLPWIRQQPLNCPAKYRFDIEDLHHLIDSSTILRHPPGGLVMNTTDQLLLQNFTIDTPIPKFTHSSRGKRGLIDVGGKALQLLFGTATQQDMDSLEGKINDKFTTLAKITSQVSFSAKKLHRRLSSVDRILHDLVSIEWNLVHKIKVIEILNTINKMDNFLTEIQLHSSYVLTIITLSTLGKIHPELIPYPAFLHLVTECAQHFRLQPILPVTPDTFPRYLSFAQVHKNVAPFNVLISIPFSDGSSSLLIILSPSLLWSVKAIDTSLRRMNTYYSSKNHLIMFSTP